MNDRDLQRTLGEIQDRLARIERDEPVPVSRDPVPGYGEIVIPVVVVPNDDADVTLVDASEQIAVRELIEPSPYAGSMTLGEIVVVKTWWPTLNRHYSQLWFRKEVTTGDPITAADGPTPIPLFRIGTELRAYHPMMFLLPASMFTANLNTYGKTSGFPTPII